jgi:hypothetical protein
MVQFFFSSVAKDVADHLQAEDIPIKFVKIWNVLFMYLNIVTMVILSLSQTGAQII